MPVGRLAVETQTADMRTQHMGVATFMPVGRGAPSNLSSQESLAGSGCGAKDAWSWRNHSMDSPHQVSEALFAQRAEDFFDTVHVIQIALILG